MRLDNALSMKALLGLTLTGTLVAGGGMAATAAEPSQPDGTVDISYDQAESILAGNPALAAEIDQMVAAVDQEAQTLDMRQISPELASSDVGERFQSTYLSEGGTVISETGEAAVLQESSGRTARGISRGAVWVDAWGFHMTLPSATIDRIAALAATGSGAAGAVAAALAVNIEGFPANLGGAIAASTVAIGLIVNSAILQACNINGNGAQMNFNWLVWSCWPL